MPAEAETERERGRRRFQRTPETAHPALDEMDGEEDSAGARDGHTRRWVRYVMPVMVEVDSDTDEIASVVTDLSFDVLPGRVTGFLGPSGAGKPSPWL